MDPTMGPVHLCSYASQPDIQIKCDGSWTTPAWGKDPGRRSDIPEGVYVGDGGQLYTFDKLKVTCRACLES